MSRLIAFDYPSFSGSSCHPGRSMFNDIWSTDPWADRLIPRRLLDQNFGLGLLDDDLFLPQVYRGVYLRPKRQQPNQQSSGMSEVSNNQNEFRVNLDVSHFKPDDLTIKTSGNKVVIHGKHEEVQDEHGYIQREFKRTYILPNDIDPNTVKSTLSGDGILTLVAPKMAIEPPKERTIPIEQMDVEPTPAVEGAKK